MNEIAHTWQWQAFFLGVCLVQLWRLFCIFRERNAMERKKKSFETYRDTGVEDEAFDSLTGDAAEAAGRAHAAVVSGRLLHGRGKFVAIGPCPKCGWIDCHDLKRRDHCPEDRTVYRTCMLCQFKWMES